jgi:hypothetical protein
MISPTLLLKAGVSNDAIALPYIQSRADLSELMALFGKSLVIISHRPNTLGVVDKLLVRSSLGLALRQAARGRRAGSWS